MFRLLLWGVLECRREGEYVDWPRLVSPRFIDVLDMVPAIPILLFAFSILLLLLLFKLSVDFNLLSPTGCGCAILFYALG